MTPWIENVALSYIRLQLKIAIASIEAHDLNWPRIQVAIDVSVQFFCKKALSCRECSLNRWRICRVMGRSGYSARDKRSGCRSLRMARYWWHCNRLVLQWNATAVRYRTKAADRSEPIDERTMNEPFRAHSRRTAYQLGTLMQHLPRCLRRGRGGQGSRAPPFSSQPAFLPPIARACCREPSRRSALAAHLLSRLRAARCMACTRPGQTWPGNPAAARSKAARFQTTGPGFISL